MERYTVDQRVFLVKTYYKYGESAAETVRKSRTEFGRNNAPSKTAVGKLIQKFEEMGTVQDARKRVYHRSGRSLENIAAVRESIADAPKTSIRHRAQQLHLKRSTLHTILTKDLHLKAYKIQLTQELKPIDHQARRTFVNWALQRKEENGDFFNKIIFSDEAHFHLGGYVNKQNCRIWGEENPRMILEKPMHPQRVTVWCGFWAGGVIGPYFFQNEAGTALSVTGDRYRSMIGNFLWNELDGIDIQRMWFQQDGATPHTANETLDLLRERFQNRIISRRGDVNWPPRSCDLTPLDFFLWGFLKEKVYVNNPETIQQLRDNIITAIVEISPQLCEKVIDNFAKRMTCCQRSRGGHLPDIIFHY